MKHALCLALLLAALFATVLAGAKDLTDSRCGCQLPIPDDWNASHPDTGGGGAAFVAGKADQTEGVSLYAIPNGGSEKERDDYLKGFEDSITEHGATIVSRGKEKLGGVDFIVLAISQVGGGPRYSTAWIGFAAGQAFQVGLYSQTNDPAKDPALSAIISSFKLTKQGGP